MKSDSKHVNKPHPWPRLQWHLNFLLGFIPYIVLFFDEIQRLDDIVWLGVRLRIWILVSPLFLPVVIWLSKTIQSASLRIRDYPDLYRQESLLSEEYIRLQENFIDVLDKIPNTNVFQILKAAIVNDDFLIEIEHSPNKRIREKAVVIVIDREDSRMMGIFDVVQSRNIDCIARARPNVDALWAGFVRQKGETTMLPNLVALVLEKDRNNDKKQSAS